MYFNEVISIMFLNIVVFMLNDQLIFFYVKTLKIGIIYGH